MVYDNNIFRTKLKFALKINYQVIQFLTFYKIKKIMIKLIFFEN